MNLLGPPSDEFHPGCSLGDHIYYWEVGGEIVIVSCDACGRVYDKEAPHETQREGLRRDLQRSWLLPGR
jgi:hypothetical protein